MADETTAFLGLVKPEVNGPQTENVWGYDINANFDKIDARFVETPTEAPLDGDIYGRRQGAWSRTIMKTDFDALAIVVDDAATTGEERNDAQDAAIAGKADVDHTHAPADITGLGEAVDDRVAGLLSAGPNVVLQYDDALGKLQISASGGSGGGGAGPPPNGDYSDIIVTNFGATWTIDNGAVTYAKMQNVGAEKLLGAIAPGVVQEIPCTAAARALLDDADAAAQRATLGLSSMATEDAANFQPKDATLTGLAVLPGVSGLVEQTGADNFTIRTIGVGAGTNIPDTAAADLRYQPKDPTLGALAALDGTPGLLEETTLDFFTKRSIGVGTAASIPTRADTDARYAQLNSPVFTGDARAVTPASTDNDTSIATTAFVKNVAVNRAGDTMSGSLTVQGNFTTNQIDCTNLYPSGAIQMPIGGSIYLYNHGASSAAYIRAEPSTGNMLFVTGTSGLGVRMTIGSDGIISVGGNLNGNVITGNAVNSSGNMSTAGTHYAGAFSAPAATITTINCTNLAAGNNIACNNGDVAGQWRVGALHSYGNINCVGTLSGSGEINCHGLVDHGDFICDNTAYIAGPCFAGGFFATSDERLKEDLQPIDNSGELLDATEVWHFKWKKDGKPDYGVIAQHAQTIVPEAVTHDAGTDGWFVDYAKYIPLLIAEVQSLRVKVDQLHTRIKDLEEAA